jgi:Zn-dependent peptidase ImmA (M78 family)/transcriptional regulator with XRE-family HTH domain
MNAPDFFGDNLRIARLTLGISLQELGERVGTTRQYLSQLETTDKKPSPDLLDALSYELGFTPEFFGKTMGNTVKDEECHFRKLASVPMYSVRECTARITLVQKIVDALDQYLDLPPVDFPEFGPIESSRDAAMVAQKCREHWELGKGPIESVARLIERAGGVITSLGDISEKVDALSVHRERPIIVINSTKNSPRLRFDLAHELGHMVMHKGVESGCKDTESQADQFASYFLLPQEVLLASYRPSSRVSWQSIKQIKIKWGVSMRAVVFRLRQANLITPSQYRTANITLSKKGSRSEEFDNFVIREKPELLRNAFRLLAETFGSNFGGIFERLGISRDIIGSLTDTSDVLMDTQWEPNHNVVPFPSTAT